MRTFGAISNGHNECMNSLVFTINVQLGESHGVVCMLEFTEGQKARLLTTFAREHQNDPECLPLLHHQSSTFALFHMES